MDPEPATLPARSSRRRWWALPIAALAALAGAWIAPTRWAPGPGRLIIERGGEVVFEDEVAVGFTDAIALRDGTVQLPHGIPIDEPFVVRIIEGSAGASFYVRLVRPGGVEEVLPVTPAATPGLYTARRRPPNHAPVVLALLGAVIVLWISEFFPLFVTSLAVPVVLAVAGVGSAGEVLAPFFDPIIVLFFSGFIMAEAMRRVGLDRWAAITIVAKMATSPVRLYAALLGTSAFLSMFMSNTAAVTVLLPIALAVTAPFAGTGYRKAAVLGVAYAATIGGVGSAIGTPANQLAIRFTGHTISFVDWFAFGLPVVLLFLPAMGVYLWWSSRVRLDRAQFDAVHKAAQAQRASLDPFTRGQWQVLAVFGAVMTLWFTQGWHGWNTGIVALGGAVVLFAIRRVEPEDLGRISWSTLLTFGGGLTLGIAMVDSGVSDWIVTRLGRLEGTPTIVGVFVVALVALVMTTVASNTAAAATLIPLAIPLAAMLHVDPVVLAVTVAIATSVDFALVIGTPPTMLAYGSGLFTPGELMRKGLPLDFIGLLILVVLASTLWPGLVP